MLAVFWHMISNDAKWAHGLMCPGVKQGLSWSTSDTGVIYKVVLQARLHW